MASYRSYTAAEYRKAGMNAGPYALEANPDQNYRTNRRKPILGVVMHITAGLTDYTSPDSSADGTTKYGMGTDRDASWHVCIDSDGIIPSVRDAYTAWHAGVQDIPNVNDASLGIEQGTGTTNWAGMPDWWVERTLRNVAVWLAPRVKKYGIPLTVIRDRGELDRAIRAGRKFGFVSHATVAPHNRTDPGIYQGRDTYPWSRLFTMIREELAGDVPTTPTSPEEDDVSAADVWNHPTTNASGEKATMGGLVRWGYINAQRAANKADAAVQKVAELAGQVAGLSNALAQHAEQPGQPLDLAAVTAAAKAGAAEAIQAITVTVEGAENTEETA